MALDALTIATQGLLSTPDQIALQGLLEAATPPTPPEPDDFIGHGAIYLPGRKKRDDTAEKRLKKLLVTMLLCDFP